jgi:predicted RNA-binding Zn ribbon-like protein
MPADALVAIDFANSRYAIRGRLQEGIGTVEDLSGWLRDHALAHGLEDRTCGPFGSLSDKNGPHVPQQAPSTELHNVNIRHVDNFVELRDAIRAVFGACVDGEPPRPEWLAVINNAAEAAPNWPALTASYQIEERTAGDPPDAARAVIARSAMTLLAGPLRAELRACRAPGCVKFFVRDHPRREWCCDHCGNRARAARHYRRHRASQDPS